MASYVTEHEKANICPEDIVSIILPAKQIPNNANVMKKTGTAPFILKHDLTVYPISTRKGEEPNETIVIEGFFLVNGHGSINQIKPDQPLAWQITADDLYEYLTNLWDRTYEEADPDDDK